MWSRDVGHRAWLIEEGAQGLKHRKCGTGVTAMGWDRLVSRSGRNSTSFPSWPPGWRTAWSQPGLKRARGLGLRRGHGGAPLLGLKPGHGGLGAGSWGCGWGFWPGEAEPGAPSVACTKRSWPGLKAARGACGPREEDDKGEHGHMYTSRGSMGTPRGRARQGNPGLRGCLLQMEARGQGGQGHRGRRACGA